MHENALKVKDKQETPADIQAVIGLYRQFSKYDKNSDEELYYHVLPSFKLNQCKIFKENNEVVAFANWAFLNEEADKQFIETKEMDDHMWNSGDIVWVHDVLALGKGTQVANWLRKKFKKFKWLRSNDDFKFYRLGTRGY